MLLNPVERYMKEKGIEEGMEKGIEIGKLEAARNMLDKGLSVDEVVEYTGLSREFVLKNRKKEFI